jgi:hypothetical protein
MTYPLSARGHAILSHHVITASWKTSSLFCHLGFVSQRLCHPAFSRSASWRTRRLEKLVETPTRESTAGLTFVQTFVSLVVSCDFVNSQHTFYFQPSFRRFLIKGDTTNIAFLASNRGMELNFYSL